MKRVGVLGSGSWGTALAVHLAQAGFEVGLWARRPEFARRLERERTNRRYLPEVEFPSNLRVFEEAAELGDSEAVLLVVPSHGFRAVLRDFLAARGRGRPLILVSGTKGIESETLAPMSRVAAEEAERAGLELRFAALSGPTFATELAVGTPTAAVIAAHEEALASELREHFSDARLRLYSSTDVAGVELAGAAKNVIAIAGGVISGLRLGHNTLAALITRGLHEITRLGVARGGLPRTFSGLAGLGDLVLTCTGGLSRNRRTGIALAEGRSLEQIRGETSMVAEGIRNSLSLTRLARESSVEMPISEQMMEVMYEGKEPKQAVEELMTRELKAEAEP